MKILKLLSLSLVASCLIMVSCNEDDSMVKKPETQSEAMEDGIENQTQDNASSTDACNTLGFTKEVDRSGTSLTINNFDDSTKYVWTIDGNVVVRNDIEGESGSLSLAERSSGTYEVCLSTSDCPAVCEQITIEKPVVDCASIQLSTLVHSRGAVVRLLEGTKRPALDFTVGSYEWTVDGVESISFRPDLYSFPRAIFNQKGTYEVCVKAISPDCGVINRCVSVTLP